jgi:hypothetical protein
VKAVLQTGIASHLIDYIQVGSRVLVYTIHACIYVYKYQHLCMYVRLSARRRIQPRIYVVAIEVTCKATESYVYIYNICLYVLFIMLCQCSDVEVSTLALATLANILSFSNTLLLTDAVTVEVLASAMPKILDVLRGGAAAGATGSVGGLDLGIAGSGGGAGMGNISSAGLSFIGAAGLGSGQQQRAQRFYAAAGVANAAAHPRLAEVLKQHGGQRATFLRLPLTLAMCSFMPSYICIIFILFRLRAIPGLPLMKELQHQSQRNLHLLGSKMGDCASVAVARLSQGGEAASVPSGALGAPGGISKYTPGTASNLQKFR